MRTATVMVSLTATLLGLGCAPPRTALEVHAKVSKRDAEKVALARVPEGTIKESTIEREHGRLVWSFDLASPGTNDITEVHVDAETGEIVSVENETPAQQAKENQQDKERK